MITEAQIVLFRFPQTDQTEAKLRPALVLRRLPGHYDDWMICMISSQLHQKIPDFDEVITSTDSDFRQSGLKCFFNASTSHSNPIFSCSSRI